MRVFTYKEKVHILREKCAELIGVLIDRVMDKLLSASIFNCNGEEAILPKYDATISTRWR